MRSLLSIEPAPQEQDPVSAEDEISQLRELILNPEPIPASNGESPQPSSINDPTEAALAELRQLLFNREQVQLGELQERLDNPHLYAEDLSKVLPEAIILLSLQRQGKLTKALTPTIEEAIQLSVK